MVRTRWVALFCLLLILPFMMGCLPLIIPAVAVGSVAADRQMCKDKGMDPPQVNPALQELVTRSEKAKAK